MSQHYFNTVHKEAPVRVTFGFDRPRQEYFLNIERLDSGDVECSDGEELEDDDTGPVYISLYDPDVQTRNFEYFRNKLQALGIEIPAAMLTAVEEDQQQNVGNYVVEYAADGTPRVLYPKEAMQAAPVYLGELSGPFGTLRVYQVAYRNNATGIELCEQDGEPFGPLSVNMVEAVAQLGANEFFVKTWNENEWLVAPALASGLFEDTGREGPIAGMTGIRPPIWKVRRPIPPAQQTSANQESN